MIEWHKTQNSLVQCPDKRLALLNVITSQQLCALDFFKLTIYCLDHDSTLRWRVFLGKSFSQAFLREAPKLSLLRSVLSLFNLGVNYPK